MTQETSSPQDRPDQQDTPQTGDVTGDGAVRGPAPAGGDPATPTVTPDQDDPDREGEDRFDAG